jgi:uncharacterized protein (TIGR00251 family)
LIRPVPAQQADAMTAPWILTDQGVELRLRLTPRGGRDALEGVETLSDGTKVVKARVRAAPVDGEANAALLKLIATVLKVKPRDLSLVSGETARIKTVLIRGDSRMAALMLAEKTGYE